MKNKIFLLVAVAVALVAVVAFSMLNKPTSSAPTPSAALSAEQFARPHSPRFGNTLGRVTVVEWFDPECESCRVMHPIFKKIVADYKDRVHFVLRYMPYHPGSMYAASALEEAREHGKFEEALDILFEKQPEWGDHHQPRPELIPTYLVGLGIPKEKLERETVIAKHAEKIRMDEQDGEAVGVRGTPTFFVNGQMIPQLGDQPLRAAIESALQ